MSDVAAPDQLADLNSHYIEGYTKEGMIPFRVPLFSQVAENLWMGGCPRGDAPQFDTIVDLYGQEPYRVHPKQIHVRCRMLDTHDLPESALLDAIVEMIVAGIERGPTLVHCQAGLNRSGLLTALTLIKYAEMAPADAIAHLRERRCDAVLCNKAFEAHILASAQ